MVFLRVKTKKTATMVPLISKVGTLWEKEQIHNKGIFFHDIIGFFYDSKKYIRRLVETRSALQIWFIREMKHILLHNRKTKCLNTGFKFKNVITE